MKKSPLFLLLLFSIFPVAAFGQGVVSGQLLKSNGKPLAYTEIELVPVNAKRLINDSRLIAVSGTTGKFSLSAVPAGKYTLSINFDDKPTDLSPYDTYFYPNTYQRSEAEVFEIAAGAKYQKLIFKLPPALVKVKITGRIFHADGNPVTGKILLGLRDLKFDRSVAFGEYKIGQTGDFAVTGFGNRTYQVGAILYERFGTTVFDPIEIVGAAESEVFSVETAPVNLKLVIKQLQSYEEIRNKYLAQLVPDFSTPLFETVQQQGE